MRAPGAVLRATLLLLLAALATGALALRDGLDLRAFRLERLWTWAGQGEIRRLATGRRARRAGSFLAVTAGLHVTLLDARGQPLRNGQTVDWPRLDAADLDGDGDDELAVTEWRERPPVQLYDDTLTALGPNVSMLDMTLPTALRLFDLDGDGRREALLGDSRGCVAALAYPRFLWDQCLTPGGGPPGDAYAVRALVQARAAHGERLLVAARASGELLALDARGQPRWRFQAGFDGLVGVFAADSDGDGRDEVFLASRNHGTLVLDAAGRRVRTRGARGYSPAAVPVEWDGDAGTHELLIAHDSGRLTLDHAGQAAHAPDGDRLIDRQILQLAAADVDGDGRDEVLAGLVTHELALLALSGRALRVADTVTLDGSIEGLERFSANDGRPAFAAAAGARLHAFSARFRRAPRWYSPVPITALATLVVGAVGLVLLRLRPPQPRADVERRPK